MISFTRLRLAGFKSFVDATEVPIEPGVTGIVGPNGCGKSNLVEALVWVMGESSARHLRGGEMDDVIFAGTTLRPARSFAEVALVLDNSDRVAPAAINDADELEVSRRIERDRFSTFRVNGREVRARDVQTLFADAASGARSPAFINQGRISQMITARPADRRSLLEEAAGIGGLAVRRHEAELRLRSAEANLTRVSDVMTTLAGQVGGLRRQARQAARYREISTLIRKAEGRLLAARWSQARGRLDQALVLMRDAEAVIVRLTGEAAAAAAREAEAAAALPALRQAEGDAAAERQSVIAARDALEAEEARLAVALAEVARRLAQIEADSQRERALSGDAAAALARLDAERTALAAQAQGEPEAAAAAERAEAEAAEAGRAAEGALNQALAAAASAEAARAAARRAASEAQARANALGARAADLARQIAGARAGISPDDRLAGLGEEIAAAQAAWEAARDRAEAADRARETARQERDRLREAAQAAAGAVAQIKAEIAGVTAALGAPVKAAAKPILEAITVAAGLEAALGAALGEDLSAPEEDEGSTGPVAWRRLAPLDPPPPLPPGCEPLAAGVEAPPVLARRLSQIGVVADSTAGAALHRQLLPGQRLVTRDGELWRWDGLVLRPGAPAPAAARLRQRNRLRELEPNLAEAEKRSAAASQAAAAAAGVAESTAAAERTAHDAARRAEIELSRLRQEQARLSTSEASARSRLAGLIEQEAAVAASRAEAEQAATAASEALAALPEPDAQRGAELRRELTLRHSALVEARGRREALRREAESRRRRIEAIAAEALSWRRQADAAQAQQAELASRRAAAEAERERLAAQPARFESRRAELRDRLAEAEATRRRAAGALADGESRQAAATRARRDGEQALAQAREEGVRRAAAAESAERALEEIQQSIIEKFAVAGATLAEQEGRPEPAAIPDLERRHERLIRERDDVGAVNLRAEAELAALEAQIVSLTTERDDLVAAIAKLRGAIAELNREGRERLLASFGEVDRHFRELFARLFGGGRAQLSLTEAEDPLEAGLEVVASPPGKKLQSLSLLSGGEQALTALALLFAVFMTNPAPICVLDEVDAPLDDANVDRFCSLVGEIAAAARTRFLVVTHHRMTMARVDRLFGVTMIERGISTLVSVDLEAAERLVEPA